MKNIFSRSHKASGATRAGFTLVEMLVVIGITTLISAATIIYSSVGQNETALTIETTKVAQLILQARELALDTYSGTSGACAYGVHFDFSSQPRTYSLFAYVPGSSRCPSAATVESSTLSAATMSSYASSSWQLAFAQGVTVIAPGDAVAPASNDILTDVLFYPPSPTTLISRDNRNGTGGTFMSPTKASKIYLRTTDGKNTATITVSPAGQVSF